MLFFSHNALLLKLVKSTPFLVSDKNYRNECIQHHSLSTAPAPAIWGSQDWEESLQEHLNLAHAKQLLSYLQGDKTRALHHDANSFPNEKVDKGFKLTHCM